MKARLARITLPICAAIFAAVVSPAGAGNLNPPVGPVAPTHKTLTEVEPRIAVNATNTPGDADSLFKITQAGSYYLTGNINGVVGKHGVEIAASGVKLDLNGFDLFGVASSLDGVSVSVIGTRNIAVVNGSVRNWGGHGVNLAIIGVTNCRIQGVLASGNAGNGISAGQGSTISDCAAASNTGVGINANIGSTVVDCSASFNSSTGFITGNGCAVSRCSAYQNSGTGIIAGSGGMVSNSLAYGNGGYGISVGSGCSVSNCPANNNASTGVVTVAGCTLGGCSAYNNTSSGIIVGTGCTVSNCSARQNGEDGIQTDLDCVVADCAAEENSRNGIFVNNGSTVSNCSASSNTLNGISCGFFCVIRGNNCRLDGNGGDGAGIYASSHSRVEGNNCASSDRGIGTLSGANVIVGNTCSSNLSDWELNANNIFGPIIDRRGLSSPIVSGFSAPSTLGSTDANANFSY